MGDFTVTHDGQEVRRLRAQKYARLLAFLAIRPNRAFGREELIELFWPDEPVESGRSCLRTALSSLRRQFNCPDLFLVGPRDSIRINSNQMVTDVELFERAIRKGDPSACSLYCGPFLPGCYDDWALDERNRLEAVFESLDCDSSSSDLPYRPGVEASWPPPPGHEMPAQILPSPITRFYGRTVELARIVRMLEEERKRLITLTGLGGFGKTRLAIEVGRRLQQRVLFVPLSEHRETDSLAAAVADAIQIERNPLRTLPNRLKKELERCPTAAILDNLEQLVGPEGARWIGNLLETVPNLAILATSRIPLGIEGESVFSLKPLEQSDAVQLFVDRARHVLPDFPESAVLAELCDCLDRMPLAIELCASWANVLSSKRMFDGLGSRFDLMMSRKQGMPDRHQSLHAVLEWSCPPDSKIRHQFGMLSVLRGSWTTEAAEAVLDKRGPQVLETLCERSLVNSKLEGSEMRFSMLESVRDFAAEFVDETGITEAKNRHNAFYCSIAVKCANEYAADRIGSFTRLDVEHANIVAAFEFGVGADEAVLKRTAVAMQEVRWCWGVRGYRSVMRTLNARLAARASEKFEDQLMIYVLEAAADHADCQGDIATSTDLNRQCVQLARSIGNRELMVQTLRNMGYAFQRLQDWDSAAACLQEALEHHSIGDQDGYHVTLAHLAGMHLDSRGDIESAEPLYRQLLEYWQTRSNADSDIALMYRCLGTCAIRRGDLAAARSLYELAIPVFERYGETVRLGDAWKYLAECLAAQGNADEAATATAEWHRLIPPT